MEIPLVPTKEMAESLERLIAPLINKPFSELGDLLTDNIRYWRLKNQVVIVQKALKFLEKKGVSPNTVPLKTLAPLLNAASLEEDPDLQERWAALLASSADPDCQDQMDRTFCEILDQISSDEAKLLDMIMDHGKNVPWGIDSIEVYALENIYWIPGFNFNT